MINMGLWKFIKNYQEISLCDQELCAFNWHLPKQFEDEFCTTQNNFVDYKDVICAPCLTSSPCILSCFSKKSTPTILDVLN
jgi:hypothetical protein